MPGIVAEIRYAIRSLLHQPAYTVVAALVLAIGIGASTAIFSMAGAIIYRPYSFPDLDRIVSLSETLPKVTRALDGVSPGNYFDWAERNSVFERTAAYKGWELVLTSRHEARQAQGFLVSPGFFEVLGVPPLKGTTFTGSLSERNSIVITYGFWRAQLAGDPDVIGRLLTLNGLGYTVIGVMPQEVDYPMYAQIWGPWITTPEEARRERDKRELSVIARLKPGVSLAQARSNLNGIATGLAGEYPLANAGRAVDVRLLRNSADLDLASRYMAVVTMAVGFLLLLACANVANLQLARGTSRRKEIALRITLGASLTRIMRQLMIEGLVLSSLGAILGLPLAIWALLAIKARIPRMIAEHLPGLQYAQVDVRMLLYALIAGILTGVLFTLPALFQVSSTKLVDTLKDASRGTTSSGGRRLRSALVVSEIGLALILLVAATVMAKTVRNLSTISQGFEPRGVIAYSVRLAEMAYPNDGAVGRFYDDLLRRLRELPEVEAAAAISHLPALGQSRSSQVTVEGQPAPPPDRPLIVEVRVASDDYFRTFGIPLLDGRPISQQDVSTSLPVAVISRSAAQRLWPKQNALGRRLKLDSAGTQAPWLTVVGIGGDVNHFYLDSQIRPTVYVPCTQQPARQSKVLLRAKAPLAQTAFGVREATKAVDSGMPVDLERVNRYYDDLAGGFGVVAGLMSALAFVALVLSAAGIYALLAYSVGQRTHEIGVRMALGARPADVSLMVVKDALRLVIVALCLGIPGALALCRAMSHALAGVTTLNPLIVGVSVSLLVIAALLASYLPARRSSSVDPSSALRCI
jgi:putative ABC transport system permease protein